MNTEALKDHRKLTLASLTGSLCQILSLPPMGTEQKDWTRRILGVLCPAAMAAAIPAIVAGVKAHWITTVGPLIFFEACLLACAVLNWRKKVDCASTLLCFGCLATATVLVALTGEGFHDEAILMFPTMVVVGAMLLDWRLYRKFATLAVVTAPAVGVVQKYGLLPVRASVSWDSIIDVFVILLISALSAGLLAENLRKSLARWHETAAALEAVVNATNCRSADFFDALVSELGEVLKVKAVLAAELLPEQPSRAQTISFWTREGKRENIDFELTSFSLAEHTEEHVSSSPGATQHQFPGGELMRQLGFSSYLGVPLNGGSGEALGLLAILDDRPIQSVALAQTLLTAFAGRAATELERQRADQALQESEDRYRTTIENLGEGVFIVDREQRVIDANPAAEQIAGVTVGGFIGRDLKLMVLPSELPKIEKELERRARGEKSTYEVEIVRGDGRTCMVQVTSAPQFDKTGQFMGAVGVFRDVTERTQIENQLTFMAHALRSAGDCIAIADISERLIYVNDALLRTYGYTEMELLGEPAGIFLSERNPPDLGEKVLAGTYGGGWRGQLWNRAKDGREFPVALTTSVVRDGRGDVVATVGVAREISDQVRAEQSLRQSERRFRELLENVKLAAVMVDIEGNITFCNDHFLATTGWTREEMMRRPATEYVAPEFRSQQLEFLDLGRAGATPTFHENAILTKTGKPRWVQWSNAVLRDPQEQVSGFASLGVDVTEHRALEEQYQQAQKLESIGRLTGGLAHDFNNLLTVINGYSKLALAGIAATDPLRESIAEIVYAGERGASLTRQLLSFSRHQAPQPRVLNLNSVIGMTERLLQTAIGEDILLKIVLDPALGQVNADAGQIDQVLLNLVVNARDAMPNGGHLTVETANVDLAESGHGSSVESHPGRYVVLSVSDSGVGMDDETKRRLFEPFFTTKPLGTGTGLGLATVYGIVKQSGGWISVSSEVGKGTAFKIYLPRVDEAVSPDDSTAPDVPLTASGAEAILLTEDDSQVRKLLANSLRKFGYTVLEAANEEEALAFAASHAGPIDLLLTDVVMPGISGPELAARLKIRRPQISVLYMSGYTENVLLQHAILGQPAAYIQKPFDADKLARKVREVLGRSTREVSIVVADDDPAIRNILRQILSGAGYSVQPAADEDEALKAVRLGDVDLVIIDLVMPDREGIETILELRSQYPNVRVIAMSGAFEGEYLKVASLAGAQATLAKPFTEERLLSTVRRVMEKARLDDRTQ